MDMMRQEEVLDLVGDVYAAAAAPERWRAVLGRIEDASHSDGLNLFLRRHDASQPPAMSSSSLDAECLDPLMEHYWQVDPWAELIDRCPSVLTTEVTQGREAISHDDLVGTEFYNDWMRRFGLLDSFAVRLDGNPSDDCAVLSGMRRADRGDYQPEDLALLQALVPHLRQAAAIDRQLRASVAQTGVLEHALDQFDTGVIVVDRHGTVVRTNRAADQIIAADDGLSIGREGLRAAHTADGRQLRALIAESIRTSLGLHTECGGWMTLRRRSERRPYCVLLSPVGVLGTEQGSAPGAAVIVVADPDRRRTVPTAALQQLWQLTPAESRLAASLAAGLDLKEAAAQLEIRISTARQYLKRVFAKTDTHRQAELVVLVARALAPLCCVGIPTVGMGS